MGRVFAGELNLFCQWPERRDLERQPERCNETVVVSTVVMHFAFIAYVLAGGFLALRWRRTMWLHVPAVIWGSASPLSRSTAR